MSPEELGRIIDETSFEVDGTRKLPCPKAFELSRKYSIALREIGKYCNENDIKISACQLGCFE
jgi:hypothetical protein